MDINLPGIIGIQDYRRLSVFDPNTVTFTLNEGTVSFQERFSLPILPQHILGGQDLAKIDFWQKPIGTGPYRFEGWKHGEELTLTVNPDYYNEAAKVEAIKYIFVPDESARISLLESGEVDAIKIDPRSMKSLESQTGIKIYSAPSANWYGINGDGVLEKGGKSFEFELIYPSSNAARKDIAIAVKTDLASVGIKVEPVAKSWDEISQELYRSNPIVAAFGSPFDPDDNNYQLWGTKFIGDGWWNPASYSNAHFPSRWALPGLQSPIPLQPY